MKIIKGDLLKQKGLLCHQVNTYGVMGGGLALQVKSQFPHVYDIYKSYCEEKEYENKLYQAIKISKDTYIVNIFSQEEFNTNYDKLYKALYEIVLYAKESGMQVNLPYKYGCGIANGNWDTVSEIIEQIELQYDIEINVIKYDSATD